MNNNEFFNSNADINNEINKLSISAQVFFKNAGKNKTFREMNIEVKEKLKK